MPMAFFSGTFFPVDTMPWPLRWLINVLPLTHTNILIRKQVFDTDGLISLAVLVSYAACFFVAGSRLIKNYSE
jgi:ABC-type polysaccharide/polyol phosphate export permease